MDAWLRVTSELAIAMWLWQTKAAYCVPRLRVVSSDGPEADRADPDGPYSCEYASGRYFLLCGLGGVLSCGTTHTLLTPVDMVKCRLQADPSRYSSFAQGLRAAAREEGWRGVTRGWAPTLLGYSLQGFFKFGLYEACKHGYCRALGDERAFRWRTALYLAASASAELVADVALAPFEAAKVRVQTQPGFTSRLRRALPHMHAEEGLRGFYKGLPPLWLRQIPYTMMKFACFERTLEALYRHVVPKPREQCSKAEQLAVTFAAGYVAGVFCAVVSHPADTVVSKLNQRKGSTALEVVRGLGPAGVWKGLLPRIAMIGTLTAAQWLIYDAVKVWLRLPRPPPPQMPQSPRRKMADEVQEMADDAKPQD